jgi:TRAP-type uncharacterized transport system substrate-binding protein
MKNKWFVGVIAVATVLLLLGITFTGDAAPAQKSINFITNPAGMGNYTVSVAQAQLISRKTSLQVIVQPTQGPKVIPYVLESGEGQVAILSLGRTRERVNTTSLTNS